MAETHLETPLAEAPSAEAPFAEAPFAETPRVITLSIDVGIRNLAYAMFHGSMLTETDVIDVASECGKRYAKSVSAPDIVKSLHARDVLRSADVVVVEQQPPRARLMRRAQAIIESYFLTAATFENRDVIVTPFSAKAKLGEAGKSMRGVKNYSKRKSASVEMCSRYLAITGQSHVLELRKKKDDVADAIVQGLAYMGHSIESDGEDN